MILWLLCPPLAILRALRRRKARVLFNPRDLWVGVYWHRKPGATVVYVTAIPTLPLRMQFDDQD